METGLYRIKRLFISGILKGLDYEEVTTVKMKVGKTVKKPCGGSGYKIVSCVAVV